MRHADINLRSIYIYYHIGTSKRDFLFPRGLYQRKVTTKHMDCIISRPVWSVWIFRRLVYSQWIWSLSQRLAGLWLVNKQNLCGESRHADILSIHWGHVLLMVMQEAETKFIWINCTAFFHLFSSCNRAKIQKLLVFLKQYVYIFKNQRYLSICLQRVWLSYCGEKRSSWKSYFCIFR